MGCQGGLWSPLFSVVGCPVGSDKKETGDSPASFPFSLLLPLKAIHETGRNIAGLEVWIVENA